jgi:hypothetical protein
MVAGGGASVIYADTICALGGSEELGRGKQKPPMDRIIIVVDPVPVFLLPDQEVDHNSCHYVPVGYPWIQLRFLL